MSVGRVQLRASDYWPVVVVASMWKPGFRRLLVMQFAEIAKVYLLLQNVRCWRFMLERHNMAKDETPGGF